MGIFSMAAGIAPDAARHFPAGVSEDGEAFDAYTVTPWRRDGLWLVSRLAAARARCRRLAERADAPNKASLGFSRWLDLPPKAALFRGLAHWCEVRLIAAALRAAIAEHEGAVVMGQAGKDFASLVHTSAGDDAVAFFVRTQVQGETVVALECVELSSTRIAPVRVR